MNKQSLSADNFLSVLQDIDLVTLHPDRDIDDKGMIEAARAAISKVLSDFLRQKEYSSGSLSLADGFLFIFNEREFTRWHTLNWWEQRRRIRAIKDQGPYMVRAYSLLQNSCFSAHIDYSDDTVAKSDRPEVKHAWMRKRLVMKECYWNAIDTISHAAYFKQKYRDQFPALCVLLINIHCDKDRETELVLGIDNGTGFLYKKRRRDSSLIRFLYKLSKLIFNRGVFYIGGMELGLQETDGELSFHGSGAVVYQGW